MSFSPIDPTGRIKIQDKATGLYLVAPVHAWKSRCKAEWTDIKEAAFGFSKGHADEQRALLRWNLAITSKNA